MSKFLDIGGTMAQCECLNCTSKYTMLYKSGSTPTNAEFHVSMANNGWLKYSIMFSGKWYVVGLCAACTQKLQAGALGQSGGDMLVLDGLGNTLMIVPRSIWLGRQYVVKSTYGAVYGGGGKQVESKDNGELTKLVKEMMTQFHDSDKVPDTFPYQLSVEYGILRKIEEILK